MLRRGDESIRHGSDRLEAKRAGYCPIVFGGGRHTGHTLSPRGYFLASLPRLDMAHA
jgi:hypothetical protein